MLFGSNNPFDAPNDAPNDDAPDEDFGEDIMALLASLDHTPRGDEPVVEKQEWTSIADMLDVELENIEDDLFLNDPLAPLATLHTSITEYQIPEVTVSNVVCQGSVNCSVDLHHCVNHLRNAELNRQNFPALFVRLKNPKVTLLLFSNGKLLATGGKSYEQDYRAMRQLTKSLQNIGYTKANLGPVTVQNLVAQLNLNFPIQLSKLVEDPLHKRYCHTQAGKFPCINYKIKTMKPNITVRIFGNGSIGFQSGNSLESLASAVKLMVPVFHQFRLPQYEPVDPKTLLGHIEHLEQYGK